MKWVIAGFVRTIYDTISHVWGDRQSRVHMMKYDIDDMENHRVASYWYEKAKRAGQVRLRQGSAPWCTVTRARAIYEDNLSGRGGLVTLLTNLHLTFSLLRDGGPSSLALQAVLDMGLGLDSISEVNEDSPSEDGLGGSDMFNLKLQLLLGPFGFLQTIIFEDNNQGALG
ncbi:hypothetical protein JCGZ_22950 [Jatropha curcas]|uniref:Uncharacterized protein n=2 Tax=Jatropha curcas TaxID=180498 RepID=A0A067L590_JATCU|nr:hypothetical protein JCGZ_22950 [Jatropha curcas]